jgi:TPR repeat protein
MISRRKPVPKLRILFINTPLPFDLKKFYRISICIFLAYGLIAASSDGAWAKPKKPAAKAQKVKVKQKPKASANRTVKAKQKTVAPAKLDPATEFEVIEDEATALNNALAVAPDDAAATQKLAEVSLRAVRAAERALSRGDETMFAAYSAMFRRRLADTRPGLESMAGRGIGAAEYALGTIELHGLFGASNVDAACARFAAAVERGFGGAKFRHAQCIEEADPGRAYTLLHEAADGGHVAATERLGRICLEADPPDVACATARLERAARDGRASATALLGWMQAEGVAGKADPARAAKLYAEAAQKGEASALNNLGELYEKGRGLDRNEKAAFENYLAAAKGGYPPAQFNVGRLYAAGRGTERNKDEARRWLAEADKAGIPQARQILNLIDRDGE